MQERVAEAWTLVPGNRPFSYFQKRLDYAEDKLLATADNEELPPPFFDSEEESASPGDEDDQNKGTED